MRRAKKLGISTDQYKFLRKSRIGRLKIRELRGENVHEKKCCQCGYVKPAGEYYLRTDKIGRGMLSTCKVCCGKLNAKNSREIRLRKIYKITESDYKAMLRAQRGRCYICRRLPECQRKINPKVKKRLAIDHDHVTGRVRGLLCSACNFAIGKFENYKERFTKYLNIRVTMASDSGTLIIGGLR
jgi:hypothetical protein